MKVKIETKLKRLMPRVPFHVYVEDPFNPLICKLYVKRLLGKTPRRLTVTLSTRPYAKCHKVQVRQSGPLWYYLASGNAEMSVYPALSRRLTYLFGDLAKEETLYYSFKRA